MVDWSQIDEQLARHDPHRRLSALFALPPHRRALVALYNFNYELAEIRERVRDPMLGDIRLAWWRQIVDALYAPEGEETERKVGDHPAAEALAAAFQDGLPPRVWIDRIVNARGRDFDADPIQSLASLRDYLERQHSTLMRLAVWSLLPNADLSARAEACIRHAGLAWGLMQIAYNFAADARRGHLYLPADILANHDLTRDDVHHGRQKGRLGKALKHIIDSARREQKEAALRYAALPAEVAPALLHCALTPVYIRLAAQRLKEPFEIAKPASPVLNRLRLVRASAMGRL